MLKEQRFEHILDQLKQHEQVTYESLAQALAVSEDTIRRDIEQLARNGLLSKIRGGAMLPSRNPLTFQDRSSFLVDEKEIIARKAQRFVKPGMTIFMDGGTTICAVASLFPADLKARVITNNHPLVAVLAAFPHIEIIVLGGVYHRPTATSTGTTTSLEASRHLADLYFIGSCGIDQQLGVSAIFETDAHVKRAMLAGSRKIVALANHAHLQHAAAFRICDMNTLDALITDLDSNDPALDDFRRFDLQLL